jgi:hypothetical protein
MDRWSRRWAGRGQQGEFEEHPDRRVRETGLAHGAALEQRIGDHYAACMNESKS